MRTALVLSILAHCGALLVARPLAARYVAAQPPEVPITDLWTGTSIEVSLAGTGGPEAPSSQGAAAPAQQSPQAAPGDNPPAGAPSSSPSTAPSNTPSAAPVRHDPKVPSTAAPHESAAPSASATARPTLRLPGLQHLGKRRPKDDKAPPKKASSKTVSPAPSTSVAASSRPAASASPASSGAAVAGAASGKASGNGTGGTFGSEGAASVRDLGRAFTRAIPAACSADPVWGKLPSGDAGKLTAEVRVDGDGHVTSAEPIGKDPPKALVNVLRRTLPMLQGGTFAVRGGTVSAGTETLEISATVSDEAGGGEGAKDNLAFSYSGGHGKASFTQTGGRHVDISVRVVKVAASD